MSHEGEPVVPPRGAGLQKGTVRLSEPNPAWSEFFQRERLRLEHADIPELVEIRHVGSTSIRTIKTKPVLDILVGVRSLANGAQYIELMRALGYSDKGNSTVPGALNFSLTIDGLKCVSLVTVEYGSDNWFRPIRFIEKIIDNVELATEYEQLKLALAEQFHNNSKAYTQGKVAFVRRVAGF